MHPGGWDRRMVSVGVLGCALWLGLAGPIVAGQDQPMFSTNADLVVLHVAVTDSRGRHVTDLPRDAFTVTEDGRPQAIQVFLHDDVPIAAGLLIDSSGSMYASRERVIAATRAFAEAGHSQDELFGLAFNDAVTAALPQSAPFINRSDALAAALANVVTARGRTSLFDAISTGLDYIAGSRHHRRALVVVSDGGDNASRVGLDHVVRKVQAANTAMYAVSLVDPLERDANPGLLRRLARETGGIAFRPKDADDVADVLSKIAADIRHAYTIGYASTNDARDGTYRRVRVSVRTPGGRPRVVVRTRDGYVAARSSGGGQDALR